MSGVVANTLNGWYKTRYGEKQKLVPEWAICQDEIPYEGGRTTIGLDFREPMFMSRSQGFTQAGSTTLDTVYDLNDPVPLQTAEVVVKSADIVIREQIAYNAIYRAQSAGDAAFGSALDEVVIGLDESHRFLVEANMLYGNTSIGTIESVANDTSTSKIVTITSATWAPGIWAQAEKSRLDVFTAPGTSPLNTNAPLQFLVETDPDNRKVKISGDTTDVGLLAAGQVFAFRGGSGTVVNTMYGIDAIVTNTGSMFGIDAGQYGLWRGNTVSLGGAALTMSRLHNATTRVVVRGGYGRIVYLMNPFAWQTLCDDQSALRRYADGSKKEMVNGATKLTFYGSNGGAMELRPHPMVKQGECFGIMPEFWLRSGASDIANGMPGEKTDDFFFNLPNSAGVEVRNYSNQYLFTRRPAKNIKITGIVTPDAP